MSEVASRQNAKFKTWLSLLEARGIKKSGQALLSGRKLVEEFLQQHPERARALLATTQVSASVETFTLSKPLFKELDVLGTNSPLLVVDVPDVSDFASAAPNGLELIVALSDPGNLGAVLRSAEGFGARRVILTEECASPFLPRALRASAGSAFRVPLARTGPLVEVSVKHAVCLDMGGENLSTFAWPKDVFLILGEEGRGIPASLKAHRLGIAMAGRLESLNALAAASIALYSYGCRSTKLA